MSLELPTGLGAATFIYVMSQLSTTLKTSCAFLIQIALAIWLGAKLMLDLLGEGEVAAGLGKPDSFAAKMLASLAASPWWVPAFLLTIVVIYWLIFMIRNHFFGAKVIAHKSSSEKKPYEDTTLGKAIATPHVKTQNAESDFRRRSLTDLIRTQVGNAILALHDIVLNMLDDSDLSPDQRDKKHGMIELWLELKMTTTELYYVEIRPAIDQNQSSYDFVRVEGCLLEFLKELYIRHRHIKQFSKALDVVPRSGDVENIRRSAEHLLLTANAVITDTQSKEFLSVKDAISTALTRL